MSGNLHLDPGNAEPRFLQRCAGKRQKAITLTIWSIGEIGMVYLWRCPRAGRDRILLGPNNGLTYTPLPFMQLTANVEKPHDFEAACEQPTGDCIGP
jgi:hypothetical protein